jgi:hypothetical protein
MTHYSIKQVKEMTQEATDLVKEVIKHLYKHPDLFEKPKVKIIQGFGESIAIDISNSHRPFSRMDDKGWRPTKTASIDIHGNTYNFGLDENDLKKSEKEILQDPELTSIVQDLISAIVLGMAEHFYSHVMEERLNTALERKEFDVISKTISDKLFVNYDISGYNVILFYHNQSDQPLELISHIHRDITVEDEENNFRVCKDLTRSVIIKALTEELIWKDLWGAPLFQG